MMHFKSIIGTCTEKSFIDSKYLVINYFTLRMEPLRRCRDMNRNHGIKFKVNYTKQVLKLKHN